MRRLAFLSMFVLALHSQAASADYPYDENPAFIAEGKSDGIVVAVIDSGIDYVHPSLKDSIWKNPNEVMNGLDDDGNGLIDDVHGWDFAANDAYPFDVMPEPPKRKVCKPEDYRCRLIGGISYFGQIVIGLIRPGAAGHGTHVAGIVKDVSSGHAAILPLRINYGAGTAEWARQVTAAVEYAASAGARVVNMSFGVYPDTLEGEEVGAVKEMIRTIAAKRGMLMAIAAGNEKTDMTSTRKIIAPGGINERHVLTVGAVDESGELADFSNIGEGIVDVYAPGVDIESTWPGGATQKASGTSMASPFIAGLAAKLMHSVPWATSADVAIEVRGLSEILESGFDDASIEASRMIHIPVILRDTAAGI